MAAEAKGVVQSCREGGSRRIRNGLKVKAQEKRVRQRKTQKKAARRTGLGREERTGNSAGLLRSPHVPDPSPSEHSPGAVSPRKHPSPLLPGVSGASAHWAGTGSGESAGDRSASSVRPGQTAVQTLVASAVGRSGNDHAGWQLL